MAEFFSKRSTCGFKFENWNSVAFAPARRARFEEKIAPRWPVEKFSCTRLRKPATWFVRWKKRSSRVVYLRVEFAVAGRSFNKVCALAEVKNRLRPRSRGINVQIWSSVRTAVSKCGKRRRHGERIRRVTKLFATQYVRSARLFSVRISQGVSRWLKVWRVREEIEDAIFSFVTA